jgi:thioesterase domain-containing protein
MVESLRVLFPLLSCVHILTGHMLLSWGLILTSFMLCCPNTLRTPLHYSDQPIYVLEKDNDLNVYDLARQNARDILKVQPDGPYLLGGHSYGGTVAMEIAAVLESWGHDVGLVLVSAVESC